MNAATPKTGRPASPLVERVHVRLKAEERADWTALAEAHEMGLSAFLRAGGELLAAQLRGAR